MAGGDKQTGTYWLYGQNKVLTLIYILFSWCSSKANACIEL